MALLTNLSVVAAVLCTMTKLDIVLRLKRVNVREFQCWLEKELNAMMVLSLKSILFCNHWPDFDDFSIVTSNSNDFKVTLMENYVSNIDHPLNKNKQSFATGIFDY